MEKDRYGQIGDRPLPFPLWCRECGVMIADSEAHDRFHSNLILEEPKTLRIHMCNYQ